MNGISTILERFKRSFFRFPVFFGYESMVCLFLFLVAFYGCVMPCRIFH